MEWHRTHDHEVFHTLLAVDGWNANTTYDGVHFRWFVLWLKLRCQYVLLGKYVWWCKMRFIAEPLNHQNGCTISHVSHLPCVAMCCHVPCAMCCVCCDVLCSATCPYVTVQCSHMCHVLCVARVAMCYVLPRDSTVFSHVSCAMCCVLRSAMYCHVSLHDSTVLSYVSYLFILGGLSTVTCNNVTVWQHFHDNDSVHGSLSLVTREPSNKSLPEHSWFNRKASRPSVMFLASCPSCS